MTKDEALKLALEALISITDAIYVNSKQEADAVYKANDAITAIKEALAQPDQEPVAWQTMEAKYPTLEKLDIRMGDGSILCNLWPQSDGDLWWEGSGTGEKFIDPKYANVTHWRVHSDTTPPQRTWVGLTDDEREELMDTYDVASTDYVHAIEAKLKEKNT